MKWNCFDWFDHYAAEKNGVPKLETQPIHTDAIWKRCRNKLVLLRSRSGIACT